MDRFFEKNGWSVVYEKAVLDNGALYFPEKLTKEFLDQARRVQGSYIFSNQYMNDVIPLDSQSFKPEWIKYYTQLPQRKNTFAFIDPAISLEDHSDYTAVCVVDVDVDNVWYIKYAERFKITPTQIIELCFNINAQFKPMCIGIEEVAYQKALLYMMDTEMKRRQMIIPVKGVKPGTDVSKEHRILGMVPRFEWGRCYLKQGLVDLEDELLQFPRGAHDDLIDSLASIETIAVVPSREENKDEQPSPANPDEYERWFRRNFSTQKQRQENDEG
jgi:predicted phage terminase large subunit-like protein